MKRFLEKFVEPDFNDSGVSFEDWERLVDSGLLTNKLYFGVGKDGHIIVDPLEKPGLLTVGGQGSGKSTFLKGCALTSLCSSGETTWQIYVDLSDKGMGDYGALINNPENACSALLSIEKIIPTMDLVFKELKARGRAFNEMDKASNVDDYNNKYKIKLKRYQEIHQAILSKTKSSLTPDEKDFLTTLYKKNLLRLPRRAGENLEKFRERERLFLDGIKLLTEKPLNEISDQTLKNCEYSDKFPGVSFIYLIFEEFHTIPNSDEVQFEDNKGTKFSVAWKMFQIARTGRSFGMDILAATQKASQREFPSDLKVGIAGGNMFAHAVSDEWAVSAIDLPKATEININGRSVSKDGFVQFPFFSEDVMKRLVKEKIKPCVGIMFGPQKEEYHNALSGSGAEGMIENYPFTEIISNYQIFPDSLSLIVARLLRFFGYEYEAIDEDKIPTEINGIATKNGKRYGVIFGSFGSRYRGDGVSDKKINSYKTDLSLINAESFICIAFGSESGLRNLAKQTKGFYLDLEDLRNTASIMDNWEMLKNSGALERKLSLCPLAENHDENAKKEQAAMTDDESVDISFTDEDY